MDDLLKPLEGDHIFGSPSANNTIILYGDFECDNCRAAYPVIRELLAQEGGEICYIFRHFPLTTVHGNAQKAAEISEAAHAQGKFWEMYDILFVSDLNLDAKVIRSLLERASLDIERAFQEVERGAHNAIVRQQLRSGVRVGVNVTPTIFVNGSRFDGELSLQAIRAALAGKDSVITIGADKVARVMSLGDERFVDKVSQMPAPDVTLEIYERSLTIAERVSGGEPSLHAALIVAELYPIFAANDPSIARRAHDLIMMRARKGNQMLLSKHLQDSNMQFIPWRSESEVIEAAQVFYNLKGLGLSMREMHLRISALVKHASSWFIKHDQSEEAFSLFFHLPVPNEYADGEILSIRNALNLYESRRVKTVERRLRGVILLVSFSIICIAPSLFRVFENPYRSAHNLNPVSIWEAIYWSVITFATVGYGDIVPMTSPGKMLAVCCSISGVLLMGIIAGLILSAVTQRRL